DEIEKANENIHNLLLQVMDDGYVQDSKGRILDFTKAIIILTSNLGISEIDALQKRIGFVKEDLNSQTITDITKESLKNKFRPEFINRINDIIVFKNLTITDCSKIVGKFLNEIIVYTSRIPIEFRYTSDIPDYLAQMGYSAEYGARELRRTVDEFVLNPLSDRIIERGLKPGDKVTAKIIRGKIRFHKN
ncbi:MAG: ATP-dependent Clp protease ATP-binding subunit, partial [Planctomycetes bacterium]|nr:ATP-dependent Clp protease ATP-binding subunit [Planctomycetota bacterium]